jgi:hypothetical protein
MDKTKEMNEASLEKVSGAGKYDDFFRIKVRGVKWPKNNPLDKGPIYMDVYAEPWTTLREVEMKVYMSNFLNDVICKTSYHGILLTNRQITMKELGIRPDDILEMNIIYNN